VIVRRLEPGETAQLRELRLRALREDPGAFAESYEAARARPPQDWAAWAADESLLLLVAIEGERWVGMVACRLGDEGSAWLSALWVDPAARGTGLGARLVDAVIDWAREHGSRTLDLSVTTNNRGAAAFYARAGFTETGRRRPLPADPTRTEVFLSRPVPP
jgi:ribosomal protein S18 acetylase RimI-like enzyme